VKQGHRLPQLGDDLFRRVPLPWHVLILLDAIRHTSSRATSVGGGWITPMAELLLQGLPQDLRRSLACTNIIESMNSIVRQVCRDVKRWRNAKMGLHWTAAGMLEAKKGFRRLKAHKHLPVLKAALQNRRNGQSATLVVERLADAA
jgi:hypothetical protein